MSVVLGSSKLIHIWCACQVASYQKAVACLANFSTLSRLYKSHREVARIHSIFLQLSKAKEAYKLAAQHKALTSFVCSHLKSLLALLIDRKHRTQDTGPETSDVVHGGCGVACCTW